MLDLLRSLEWCGGGEITGWCPVCDKADGHAPDCRLDRAIRELASSAIEEVPEPPPIRVGSLVCPKPVPYKGTVWRVDRIVRGRAYMTRVDRPAADYPVEAVFPVGDVVAAEPTVDEMAREMRLTKCHECGRWRNLRDLTRDCITDQKVANLYREHKAKQIDATIAGKRVGPWLTPPAPKVYEASGPPTDPSALAAWLYGRVMPGRTIAESPGRRFVVLAVDMSADGQRVFVDEANGYAIPRLRQAPITRLLNPDGTVLWEAT